MEGVVIRIHRHPRPLYGAVARQGDVDVRGVVEINGRGESELTQRLAYGRHEDLEDRLLVGKLDLRLGGVYIDIDGLGRDVKIDEERRLVIRRQHTRISGLDGFLEIGVTHIPPVDEEILLRLAGGALGLDHEAVDGDHLRLGIDIHEGGGIDIPFGVTEDRLDTLFLRAGGQFEKDLVVVNEGERDLGIDQHDMIELRQEVTQLRLVGLEELTAYGDVEEEVGDLDVRAHGADTRLLAYDVRAVYLQQRARLVLGAAGSHLHLRHGADGRQRLSAETHRTEREEVLRLAYLTGSVALERQTGVRLAHALSVVDHLQQRAAGIANDDLNTGGTRVQAVLHQLLEARGRALNDLARRNLVGYGIR